MPNDSKGKKRPSPAALAALGRIILGESFVQNPVDQLPESYSTKEEPDSDANKRTQPMDEVEPAETIIAIHKELLEKFKKRAINFC